MPYHCVLYSRTCSNVTWGGTGISHTLHFLCVINNDTEYFNETSGSLDTAFERCAPPSCNTCFTWALVLNCRYCGYPMIPHLKTDATRHKLVHDSTSVYLLMVCFLSMACPSDAHSSFTLAKWEWAWLIYLALRPLQEDIVLLTSTELSLSMDIPDSFNNNWLKDVSAM